MNPSSSKSSSSYPSHITRLLEHATTGQLGHREKETLVHYFSDHPNDSSHPLYNLLSRSEINDMSFLSAPFREATPLIYPGDGDVSDATDSSNAIPPKLFSYGDSEVSSGNPYESDGAEQFANLSISHPHGEFNALAILNSLSRDTNPTYGYNQSINGIRDDMNITIGGTDNDTNQSMSAPPPFQLITNAQHHQQQLQDLTLYGLTPQQPQQQASTGGSSGGQLPGKNGIGNGVNSTNTMNPTNPGSEGSIGPVKPEGSWFDNPAQQYYWTGPRYDKDNEDSRSYTDAQFRQQQMTFNHLTTAMTPQQQQQDSIFSKYPFPSLPFASNTNVNTATATDPMPPGGFGGGFGGYTGSINVIGGGGGGAAATSITTPSGSSDFYGGLSHAPYSNASENALIRRPYQYPRGSTHYSDMMNGSSSENDENENDNNNINDDDDDATLTLLPSSVLRADPPFPNVDFEALAQVPIPPGFAGPINAVTVGKIFNNIEESRGDEISGHNSHPHGHNTLLDSDHSGDGDNASNGGYHYDEESSSSSNEDESDSLAQLPPVIKYHYPPFNPFKLDIITPGNERLDLLIYIRLAQEARRFKDMAFLTRQLATLVNGRLSPEEAELFCIAHKQVLAPLRQAFRVYCQPPSSVMMGPTLTNPSAELPPDDIPVSDEHVQGMIARHGRLLTGYAMQISYEIRVFCKSLIDFILQTVIRPELTAPTHVVTFLKYIGDLYRFIAEASVMTGSTLGELDPDACRLCRSYYHDAALLAERYMSITSPIRLGLLLNYSVAAFELFHDHLSACEMAKCAYARATTRLSELSQADYRKSTVILQLMRDNLTLWLKLLGVPSAIDDEANAGNQNDTDNNNDDGETGTTTTDSKSQLKQIAAYQFLPPIEKQGENTRPIVSPIKLPVNNADSYLIPRRQTTL